MAPTEFGTSARTIAGTFVQMACTRIELGATELAEERLRLAQRALVATVTLFLLGTGVVVGVVAAAWWAGPEHAGVVLASSAMVLLGGGAAGMWRWQVLRRRRVPLLNETIAQLRADAELLAPTR